MRLRAAIALTAACLFGAAAFSGAQDPGTVTVIQGGGAEGGPALYLNNGDVIGVRNIQGGTVTNSRGSLNLDLGAGSSADRGDIVLNWDTGRCTLLYAGHPEWGARNRVAKFCPDGITFYKPIHGGRRWSWLRR